jgi:hypothetical protein
MPAFCRHSRSAVNRLAAAPVDPRVAGGVALALVVEVELLEDPPHAASARLASTTSKMAAAVGVCLRLLLMI